MNFTSSAALCDRKRVSNPISGNSELIEAVGVRMFYLIGLGLGGERDVSVKGLEIIKRCDKVFLESYTAILSGGPEKLSEYYGRPVEVADRNTVESEFDEVLDSAKAVDIALLVVGDPFGATTHTDIVMRAREKRVSVEIIHNASIMTAVGCCGLSLYEFGRTVSIVFFTETWRPDSFYDKIKANRSLGLHTLCLLDIKVKEQSEENLARGRAIFEPPRFMTVAQAAQQLLELEERRKENAYDEDTKVVGLARVGSDTQRIVYCSLKDMAQVDLGPPLHSLVIPGKTYILEEQFLNSFMLPDEKKGAL